LDAWNDFEETSWSIASEFKRQADYTKSCCTLPCFGGSPYFIKPSN
jgi:hypothetical protein